MVCTLHLLAAPLWCYIPQNHPPCGASPASNGRLGRLVEGFQSRHTHTGGWLNGQMDGSTCPKRQMQHRMGESAPWTVSQSVVYNVVGMNWKPAPQNSNHETKFCTFPTHKPHVKPHHWGGSSSGRDLQSVPKGWIEGVTQYYSTLPVASDNFQQYVASCMCNGWWSSSTSNCMQSYYMNEWCIFFHFIIHLCGIHRINPL